ncbi:LysR family transcriptional regulator [Xanthobacter albus]|uniref:LysR family transcriptional regulator n=1 Tax=Xanthobacter albus TaxID=3119929 RepID=UPI00372D2354
MKGGCEFHFELRHLRYFVAAAEHGSFRRALAALGTQETAVSRCIRDLEDRIGASLFITSPGGVRLTLAGQRFLRRARYAMEQIEEGTREVRAIGGTARGHLSVGLFSSLASGFRSRLFDVYDDRHPGVQIDFADASAREHSVAVGQLETDVAFTIGRLNVHNCEANHLWAEGLCVALPPSHHLAQKESVSWADLMGEIFLVRPGAQVQRCGAIPPAPRRIRHAPNHKCAARGPLQPPGADRGPARHRPRHSVGDGD